MKLSTRGRYGTRLLLDLASRQGSGPILLKDIAHRQQIALPYLEHLITPLIAAGYVRSTRGARGGVTLAKTAGEVKLGDVIQILEGSIAPVECVDNPKSCPRSGVCATRDVWIDLKTAMTGVLDAVTLEQLLQRQKRKDEAKNQEMYYI